MFWPIDLVNVLMTDDLKTMNTSNPLCYALLKGHGQPGQQEELQIEIMM